MMATYSTNGSRVVAILWLVSATALGQTAPEPRRGRLYAMASAKVFNAVNRNDARAAIKVWFDVLGQKDGWILDSKVDIADNVTEMKERLLNHSVEMLVLSAREYLELESSRLMVPVISDVRGSQIEAPYSYVLLVKPSAGTATLASLRGKTVLIGSRGMGDTGFAWLDVILAKEKLGRASSHFASVKALDKPQACILPVFFGTADACVVDEVSLNLAKEMNPQLGQLMVLARSRPLLDILIAVPNEVHPFQKDLINAMLVLHQDSRGRQLLMVFKTDRLVLFRPSDLDAARELWRDYYRLPGPSPIHASTAAAETSLAPGGH